MENEMKICVYCASSDNVSNVYKQAAEELGIEIGSRGITCVNGAGCAGLMRTLSDATMKSGGKAIGVIPRFMCENGWCHPSLSQTIITETIHERKDMMATMSDAFIALPGGCGTMEELMEIITWRQLKLTSAPIVIYNVDGYYDNLLAMLHTAVEEKFMHQQHSALWSVATTAKQAVDLCFNAEDIVPEDKYSKE